MAPQWFGSLCGLMQTPLHKSCPVWHVRPQVPFEQTFPWAHTWPAVPASATPQPVVAPQKPGFVLGSTHVGVPFTVQSTRPPPQFAWQEPDEQTSPAPHVTPAVPASPAPHPAVAPQCAPLLVGSMHEAPHATCPAGQLIEQTPPAQAWPLPHAVPAEPVPPTPHPVVAPQFVGSDVGSMHLLLQSTVPAWHVSWHMP
jgi:hypothetical protein